MTSQQRLVENVKAQRSFKGCSTCETFFEQYTDTPALLGRPTLLDVQRSGQSGCSRCKTLWLCILNVCPLEIDWSNARVFGQILRRVDNEYIRIGIQDTEDGDCPREWVDVFDAHVSGSVIDIMSPPLEPGSDTWFGKLGEWISLCESQHLKCRPSEYQKMPTRVIDVLDDGTMHVVLRDTSSLETKRYLALSHCWGPIQPIQTTISSLDDHKSRISWTSLPPLFRDAITIARKLKIQYIWIDSLCIIQDDEDDWARESAEMSSYYGYAWLTLAANSAPDSSHGCFPAQRQQPIQIHSLPDFEPVVVYKVPTHLNMKALRIRSAVSLFRRAWAFQERLLSKRVLHLGPEEMVWECSSGLFCECGDPPDIWNGRPEVEIKPFLATHYNAIFKSDDRRAYWHTLLEMYLMRALTYESDKLTAIEGLAIEIGKPRAIPTDGIPQTDRASQYVLGLWFSTFPTNLLWTKLSQSGSRNSLFPSWSWASITGSWTYQGPPGISAIASTASVIDAPLGTWDIERSSRAKNYPITISGQTLTASLHCFPSNDDNGYTTWELRDADTDPDPDLFLSIDIWPEEFETRSVVSVLCLELGTFERFAKRRVWGLILKAVADSSELFERVGVISTGCTWYQKAVQMEVTII